MIIDFLNWFGIEADAHIAPAIGGLFGFAGVVFTGMAAICAWLGKQFLTRRERRRDIRIALWAEMEVQWRLLFISPEASSVLPEIEKRMKAKGGGKYTPFFSRYLDAEIYKEIKNEIAILGREEIPHIVRFYHHMAVMNNFVSELRNDQFAAFPTERKLQMIGHLYRMIDLAVGFAEEAIVVLEKELKIPAEKTIAYTKATSLASSERAKSKIER